VASSPEAIVYELGLAARLRAGAAALAAQLPQDMLASVAPGSCFTFLVDWHAPGLGDLEAALRETAQASFGRNDAASDATRLRFYDAAALPPLLDLVRFLSANDRQSRQALEDAVQSFCNVCFHSEQAREKERAYACQR
jgi:hypothetical protein